MANRLFTIFLLLLTCAAAVRADEAFDEKVAAVERLRGVSFKSPVEHRTMARADLRGFLRKQLDKEQQGGAEGYLRALAALYLVRSGTTVDPMLDLYDAQVLAFYDPISHVYYSLDTPPPNIAMLPTMADAIQIHELVHALQDQRFDAGPRSIAKEDNWDALTAYQSLLEGEAVLVMLAYLGDSMGMTLDAMVQKSSIVDAIRQAASQGAGAPEGVPPYFIESLQFPYVDGLAFVVDAYKAGGWKAIDALHANPPVSTEEIIHPEIYKARVAAATSIPPAAAIHPTSGDLVDTVLGEFNWAFVLGKTAGAGWRSDLVRIRTGSAGATVLVDTTWDSSKDATEFIEAYHSFLEKNGAKNIRMVTLGNEVRAAYGVDAAVIRKFMAPGANGH